MTTDRSTERIIDLLYGELSPEEEAELRAEVAESAELRAELSGYEVLVDQIREAMPEEAPSSQVRGSILDAARAAAAAPQERAPRQRNGSDGEATGFWGRTGVQRSQLALVAAVLLTGTFVVKLLQPATDSAMAPASDISIASEALPAPSQATVGQSFEEPASEEAVAEGRPDRAGEVMSPEESEATARGVDLQAELEAKPEPDAVERRVLLDEEELSPRETKARSRTAAARRAPAAEPAPARAAVEMPARKKSEVAPTRSDGPIETSKGDDAPPALNIDRLEGFSGRDDGAVRTGSSDPNLGSGRGGGYMPAPAPQAKADRAPEEAEEAATYRPAPGTIADVDFRFRERDYRGTIAAADKFTEDGGGSETENARALHLKAQSMMALGQYAVASRIFGSIRDTYPNYRPNEITQAQADVENRLRSRREAQSAPAQAVEADEEGQRLMPASSD